MRQSVKIKGYKKALRGLDYRTQQKVAKSTLNKVGRKAATDVKRGFGKDYNITQKLMGVKFKPASGKSLNAYIEAPSKNLSVTKFKGKAKQTRPGVVASIKKGSKQLYQGQFLATMPSSQHRGVFYRKTQARLPIQETYGANFAHLLGSDYGRSLIDKSVKANLDKIFNQVFKFYAEKKLGKI